MIAVILAGGQGTRLRNITKMIPKPMVPIDGKPILEYQIENLKKNGIQEIIFVVGYLKEKITDYFGDGEKWEVNIQYVIEEEPLGTAGALYYLKETIKDPFILLFGDLVLDIYWKKMIDFHQKKEAEITLFAHPNSHPYDSDLLEIDKENKVIKWHSKQETNRKNLRNLVNAGIYIISPNVLNAISRPQKKDFEKDILLPRIENNGIYAYCSSEYVKDMGTEDRFASVTQNIKSSIVTQKNLKYPQKAIFLDRDGTINQSNGFISKTDDFELLPTVVEAIKRINESEYLCIVITNQPVLARGECSFETLKNIHNKMETLLGKEGAYIDAIYFCPHHPDKGFEGEIKTLKKECNCRKPKIGMVQQAKIDYNIDLNASWFIGDTTTDVQMGINAGVKTVLVLTGVAGKDGKYLVTPLKVVENLGEAISYILER